MNSNDPLFKNYMALFLSIVSKHSVTQSLIEIGYFQRTKKKINFDDIEMDYIARHNDIEKKYIARHDE